MGNGRFDECNGVVLTVEGCFYVLNVGEKKSIYSLSLATILDETNLKKWRFRKSWGIPTPFQY